MVEDRFGSRLRASWAQSRFLCVGLDPDPAQLAAVAPGADAHAAIVTFGRAIVDATADLAIAYKPNSAFYEQFGPEGMAALRDVIAHIHAAAPHAVVILDAKRGDIEHTNSAYAIALFDTYDADAVTIHPYLGRTAAEPFLSRSDRGVIVLCRTSNPGGGEFQDLRPGADPLYLQVAASVESHWNQPHGNCGLLVGATWPTEVAHVREAARSLPLLIAGIGRQGGDLRATIRAGLSTGGGIIVSASRSISHAGTGAGFADAARAAAIDLTGEIALAVN